MRLTWLVVLMAAACAPDAKAPQKPATALLFFSSTPLADNRLFPSPLVRGTVNGRETVFIVDTGAQVSVIDDKLARAAGLALSGGGEAKDPSGEAVAMTKTAAPHLAIDGLGPLPDGLTAVIAMPDIMRNLGIGAVLSPQMIARDGRAIVVDLQNRELRLDDGSAASSVSKSVFDLGAVKVCRYDDNGFAASSLVAMATIDGIATPIELDTGSSTTFVVDSSEIGKKLGARVDDHASMQIGEFDVSGILTTMPGRRSGCGYDGRVGIDRLRTCTIWIGESTARGTCTR